MYVHETFLCLYKNCKGILFNVTITKKKKKKKKKLKLNLLKLKVSTKDIEGHTFHDGLKVISSSKNQPYKTIFLTWLILILHFESEF